MLKPSLKNNKAIYVGLIFVLIAAVIASYFYFKPANKEITKKPIKKPTITKPIKPPKVLTYKQKVIVKDSFSKEKSDREGFIYPKKPQDYGILTQMEGGGPTSIAVDRQENLYVLDSIGSNIKKYSKNGKFIKAIPSPFEVPTDIAVDDDGNLYVQDDGEYSVLKIDQNGKVLLEYSLSEEISPKGASSLYLIELVNGVLYGICSFDKSWNPHIFELGVMGLREGESASFKIGTTKKTFSSKQQLRSIRAGVPGKDGNIYDWYRRKDDRVVYFSPINKSIPKILLKEVNYKLVAGSQESFIDKRGNLYDPYGLKNKKSFIFLIQKYSNGQLVTEATLPYDWSNYYQWKRLIAVANSGTIYYLYTYANIKNKDHLGGVKIIKCTLK